MGEIKKTKIDDNFSVIELHFSYDGQDHTSLYVIDKANNRRELVGTSFDGFEYTFNSRYVIFTSHDGIEIVFDIHSFDFITDTFEQMRSYQELLDSGLDCMSEADKSSEHEHLILDLKSSNKNHIK